MHQMDVCMLTERDKKALQFAERHSFLAKWVLWVLPLVFLVLAGGQLQVAAALTDPVGVTLAEVISLWFAGLDSGSSYSGLMVSAIVRVERALGMFCVGVAFAGLAAATTVLRGREKRLYVMSSTQGAGDINA